MKIACRLYLSALIQIPCCKAIILIQIVVVVIQWVVVCEKAEIWISCIVMMESIEI
jgi:hypothetical protein